MNQAAIEKFLKPTKERGAKLSMFFGTVIGVNGSTLVVQPRSGGTVYATTYAYVAVGGLVACLAQGTTIVAFAAKDAKRLENELEQAGLVYTAGDGIVIEENVISANVTPDTISNLKADTIPISFIEAL